MKQPHKDYYYEGIINDAKDSVQYSDWSDARGDAYSWWSDARGAVYSDWSDTRGDLYSFYSDMRSELYSGDSDGAADELQDFKDKVVKMKLQKAHHAKGKTARCMVGFVLSWGSSVSNRCR